jgi:uncharacterized C2H2 Zn-finger protein
MHVDSVQVIFTDSAEVHTVERTERANGDKVFKCPRCDKTYMETSKLLHHVAYVSHRLVRESTERVRATLRDRPV